MHNPSPLYRAPTSKSLFAARVCIALAALLSASVMIGWFSHYLPLIRVRPTFVPMVFNTAFNILVLSTALFFYSRRREPLAAGFGAIAVLIGACTLAEYMTGIDLHLDQLFIRDYVLTLESHPGRMSPLTSICSLLMGLALLAAVGNRARAFRILVFGSLSSVVLALSVVAFLGYLTGLTGTYGWKNLTPMALHTALGFALLSCSAVTLAWQRGCQKGGPAPRWLPFPVALAVMVGAMVLSQALHQKQEGELRRTIEAKAEDATSRIRAQLDSRLLALRRMAQRRGATDQRESTWRTDAANYVADFHGFKAIEWADNASIIRWVEPVAGNKAVVGLDLTLEERRRRAVDLAVQTFKPVLTHAVQLVQGGKGFLSYIAVPTAQGRNGLIIGVFNSERLFDSILPPTVASGYGITLRDSSQEIYQRALDKPKDFDAWAVNRTIDFYSVKWSISIWPSPQLLVQQASPLPTVVMIGGVFVALLFGFIVYLAQSALIQARQAELAATALHDSEERFRMAFDDAPIGMALVSKEGRWLQVNRALCRILGYEEEELLRSDFQSVTHPDDLDTDIDKVKKVLRGEIDSYQMEKRFVQKGGEIVNAMLSVSLVRDAEGRPIHFVSQIEDITQRKRALEKLRQSEERFRLVVEGVNDYAMLTLTSEGNIASWNAGAERLKGYREEEIIGRHFSIFYPPETVASGLPAKELKEAAEKGRYEDEGWRVRQDGSRFWASVILTPIRDEAGELRGFAKITHDLSERRSAASRLSDIVSLQKAVLDNVAYSIIATDPSGNITVFNAAAERLLGYLPEEMIGKTTPGHFHVLAEIEQRAAELTRQLGRLIEPGFEVFVAKARENLPDEHEWTYVRKDGETFPVLLSITAQRDEAGEITGFLGIANDITERKKAGAALAEASQRLRLATQIAGVGVWDWNVRTGEILYDEQMFALYGLEKKTINYQNWADQVLPEDLEEHAGSLRKTMRSGGRSQRQFRIRRQSDGALRIINAAEMAVTDASGETIRMVGVNRDVTDIETAIANLSAGEELLREFIKHTPAAIAMLDTEMRYVHASERWIQDYHLEGGEIIGKSHYEIFPDIPENWKVMHRRVLAGAVESCDEDEFPRANGHSEWLQWEARPWFKAGGEVGGIIFFTQVITERKKEEAEKRELNRILEENNRDLLRQNREIQNFYHTLSHELKTPLTSTREFVSIVLDGIAGEVNEEQREYLEIARSGCKQLQVCINDLLDVTRLETGKLHVDLVSAEFGPFLSKVVGGLQPMATERELCLSLELAPDLGSLPFDGARITQVINNLVGNAFKFTPPGGRVTVRASRLEAHPGFVAIAVTDTGRGIPADKVDRIFERLYQVKDSDAATEQGMGLGLYICRELVQLHGGCFEVESELNRGSVFTFYLPMAPAAGPRPSVLVVDDESAIRQALREALEPAGYSVALAEDGREAIDLASKSMPDLVVMDLKMSQLDGASALQELRRQSPELHVIIHTGFPDGPLMHQARELSPFTLLAKPCSMQQMVLAAQAELHRPFHRN